MSFLAKTAVGHDNDQLSYVRSKMNFADRTTRNIAPIFPLSEMVKKLREAEYEVIVIPSILLNQAMTIMLKLYLQDSISNKSKLQELMINIDAPMKLIRQNIKSYIRRILPGR